MTKFYFLLTTFICLAVGLTYGATHFLDFSAAVSKESQVQGAAIFFGGFIAALFTICLVAFSVAFSVPHKTHGVALCSNRKD